MERVATPVAVESERRLPGWLAPFASLRYRDFALLWTAQLTSGLGMWMEMIGRSWLVYEMTGSAAQLGGVNLARAVPQLFFGLMAGVAADRMDRQKLVMASMSANWAMTLVMAFVIWFGLTELWHLYAYSVIGGVVMAFQMPVRQAMIPSVVPQKDLMNAFALNNMAFNVTRIAGPTLAGVLIVAVGIAGAFFAKAFIFIFALVAMGLVKLPAMKSDRPQIGAVQSFTDGMRYAFRENPEVRGLLIMTLIPMLFAMPYMTLMPVFAGEVLHMQADGYSLLMTMSGIGALAGSIVLASLGDFSRKGLLVLGGTFVFGLTLAMTGASSIFLLAMGMMLLVGLGMTVFSTTANTLLMVLTPDEYRGRVMSIYMLDMALNAFGAMLAGVIADSIGIQWTLGFMGGICAVLAAAVFFTSPRIRNL